VLVFGRSLKSVLFEDRNLICMLSRYLTFPFGIPAATQESKAATPNAKDSLIRQLQALKLPSPHATLKPQTHHATHGSGTRSRHYPPTVPIEEGQGRE
jgi:hypothetical protein